MLVAPIIYLEPNMMSRRASVRASPPRWWAASTIRSAQCWAGFIVGVVENLVGAYVIGTELKLTVALVLIVGVLLVKPTGLFGRVFVTRV